MSTPSTMAAAVLFGLGGPEQIEVRSDWPCPQPGPGEASVRVAAAAANNTDIWSREGAYGTAEDPDAVVGWKGVPLDVALIQGIDVAGRSARPVSGCWSLARRAARHGRTPLARRSSPVPEASSRWSQRPIR